MILAAGLLVLLGLGLFVGGIVTGQVALYWACVAACGLAAVVLVVARLRMAREAGDSDRPASEPPSRAATPSNPPTGARQPEEPGSAPQPVVDPEPAGAAALPTPEPAPRPEPVRSVGRPRTEEPPVPPTSPAAPDDLADEHTPARRGAHEPRETPAVTASGEPGEEDVEVTDLLLVVDLDDEVLVVDEHPRYHLADCPFLDGRDAIPLPMVEARIDGFTPCDTCRPVRHLAGTERSRRQAARGN